MKTNSPLVIPAHAVEAGQEILTRVVAPVAGVHIALLCTPDGFEITALRIRSELPTERLSAMAGSPDFRDGVGHGGLPGGERLFSGSSLFGGGSERLAGPRALGGRRGLYRVSALIEVRF